ncbi:MAG: hypothetical protein OXD30_10890 [Bryobacterales bacterium]|nr:hypothetical protein [Bryobacterales bacterium]
MLECALAAQALRMAGPGCHRAGALPLAASPAARAAAECSGLWAEVALDGIVLWDRDWKLSAQLARIRRRIAGGRLVRRVVHGQPYWTEAA